MPRISSPHPSLPHVVIVGRANVGKSTLFNRIAGIKLAMTSPIPGTTRDIKETTVHWRDAHFVLSDTAGLDIAPDHTDIPAQMIAHAALALSHASLVVMVVDVRDGVLAGDRAIAAQLRRLRARVVLVANKADNPRLRDVSTECWRLGFGAPLITSALNGSGVGDALDTIVDALAHINYDRSNSPPSLFTLTLIGKPNVGKSTLLNALVGKDRALVSAAAHTTREPLEVPITWDETPLTLVDTAGMRKKASVTKGLEDMGVKRSIAALTHADVALLVIDLAEGVNDQDKALAGLIESHGVAMVIVGNKWDLIRDAHTPSQDASTRAHPPRIPSSLASDEGGAYLKYLRGKIPFAPWAPIAFVSAKHRSRLDRVMELSFQAVLARRAALPDASLDAVARAAIRKQPMPQLGPKRRRPTYMSFAQTASNPPTFAFTVKTKERFPETYLRYLEKELRKTHDLTGTPVRIVVNTIR